MASDSVISLTHSSAPLGGKAAASMQLSGRAVLAAWSLSIVLHAALMAVMFLVVFPYAPTERPDVPLVRAQIIGEVDGTLNARTPSAHWRAEPMHSEQVGEGSVPIIPLEAAPGATPQGIGAGGPPEDGSFGEGSRGGLSIVGIGAAGGGGGDFSGFGLTGGQGAGPQFFGLGGNARGVRSVVYVVDRSGSMLDTFNHVRAELKRSIGALRRSQKFHVIFFNAGEPLENPPGKLVSAIEAQKTTFFEFLNGVFPEGSTHPERSMRRALALEPDLIYFLTDGEFDRSLLAKLNEWNKDHKVRIFTIAFFDSSGALQLEQIAREHGGEYKFVSEHDLP